MNSYDLLKKADTYDRLAKQAFLSEKAVEAGHLLMDALGLIPVYGEPIDVINGLLYATEGRYFYAALCLMSSIPIIGDVLGKGGKLTAWLLEKFPKAAPKIVQWVPRVGKWIRDLRLAIKSAMPMVEKKFDELEQIAKERGKELDPHAIQEMKDALRHFAETGTVESEDGAGADAPVEDVAA